MDALTDIWNYVVASLLQIDRQLCMFTWEEPNTSRPFVSGLRLVISGSTFTGKPVLKKGL